VATISTLIERVRLELGDLGKSFVEQFMVDGTTNRFKIDLAPLDGPTVIVQKNGIDISSASWVEESTGVIVLETVPADGDLLTVSGTYFRYFTPTEMSTLVTTAITEHAGRHVDSAGRQITIDNLPSIEEYPVAVYATTLALYTLATDAAFDIDIAAPDGVNIPRSERYRQLMEMVQTRKDQYRELCSMLGIGLYTIDVLTLNRISKATGRLIPVYNPQEVDDRSYPHRVHVPPPTYGDSPVPWITEGGELTAYQGRAFITTLSFTGDFTGKSFLANLLTQRGTALVIQHFNLDVVDNGNNAFTATLSLTADQTSRLAERTYWSFSTVDDTTKEQIEFKGGDFFTIRVSSVVL